MSVVEDSSPAAPSPQPVPVRLGATRAGPPREVVLRKDRWWVQPLVTGLGLLAFIVYATWAAFRNGNYFVGLDHGRNYLSPLYSPCLAATALPRCAGGRSRRRIGRSRRRFDPDLPAGLPPHLLLLPQDLLPLVLALAAGLRRRRCRLDQAGRHLRSRYTGETRFPLVLQNIHRYFWYFTLVFAGMLT